MRYFANIWPVAAKQGSLEKYNDNEYEDVIWNNKKEIFLTENNVYFCRFRFLTIDFFNKIIKKEI